MLAWMSSVCGQEQGQTDEVEECPGSLHAGQRVKGVFRPGEEPKTKIYVYFIAM